MKFSFERLANLKDQPADMAENLGPIEVVDPQTVRISMADKTQPLLTLFTSVTYSVYDSKAVIAQGGTSGKDAEKADKATTWLDTPLGGDRPLRAHRLDAEPGGDPGAQQELLARPGRVREGRDAPHRRRRRAGAWRSGGATSTPR